MKILFYEVSYATPEVLGSGSFHTMVERTSSELEAFKLLSEGRNNLIRVIRADTGKRKMEWYDNETKEWRE